MNIDIGIVVCIEEELCFDSVLIFKICIGNGIGKIC